MPNRLDQHISIGTAGWSVPAQHSGLFPAAGSHLARYATRLSCVEVNSSFYRPHRRATWERWAAATPANFRFAVKLPKAITHQARLLDTRTLLAEFFNAATGLGEKLGPVLVQLPPSLAFDAAAAHRFFTEWRAVHAGPVALEPRHASWFTAPAEHLLQSFQVARVAADPAKASPEAAHPGGWAALRYWRLHGSPRTYYSIYSDAWLAAFAAQLQAQAVSETWIVFDNTALGHAAANAVALDELLR